MYARFKNLALGLGFGLAAFSVCAAEYFVVIPIQGKRPSADIQVSLAAATLPEARVGVDYSYSLLPHLLVTGDPSLNLVNATWSAADRLPDGLVMSSAGVISGKPSVENEAGTDFNVVARYRNKDGQQRYSIIVNGAALEVVQISTGDDHSCAVTTTGAAKCWGLNLTGQLGDGTTTTRKVPTQVTGLTSGVTSIAAGGEHTCAILAGGKLVCWGRSNYGQVGFGATGTKTVPTDVVGLPSGVVAVATGTSHTCALSVSGRMLCWGRDNQGQLGDNASLTNQPTPVDVQGLASGVQAIAAGYSHTCAVTASGGLKCWGLNGTGQLGVNSYTRQPVPADVVGLSAGVRSVGAGYAHTCALLSSGSVKCMGDNTQGQLGRGAPLVESTVPVDVPGLSSVSTMSAGDAHTCAVTTSGQLFCWGSNDMTQLGIPGAPTIQATPLQVPGLRVVRNVEAGWGHTCVVMANSMSKCVGINDSGQLGTNSTTASGTYMNVRP